MSSIPPYEPERSDELAHEAAHIEGLQTTDEPIRTQEADADV